MDRLKKYSRVDVIGKTFQTHNFGSLVVLRKSDAPMSRKHYLYRVKFLNTGTELWVRKANIIFGSIIDPSVNKTHPLVGKVNESQSYGTYRVIRQVPRKYMTCFEVEFALTGYRKTVQLGVIQSGEIRDPYYPSMCGVAYFGKATIHHYLYNRWRSMISRCYNPKDPSHYLYGGSGVTVCDRWLSLEKFIEDAPAIPGFDKQKVIYENLQLDKDKHGAKIYSPDTCEWLTGKENQLYRRPRYSVKPYVRSAERVRRNCL